MNTTLLLALSILLTASLGLGDQPSQKQSQNKALPTKKYDRSLVGPLRLDFPVQKSPIEEPITPSAPTFSSQKQGLDFSGTN